MKIMKKMLVGITLAACALMLALPASATTFKNTKTIQAGAKGNYFLVDQNISGHQIQGNSFMVEPLESGTTFDIVYATGTKASPSVMSLVGYKSKLSRSMTDALIMSSAGENSGAVCGIRVSKGSVKLTVYSQSNQSSMGLSLVNVEKAHTPLRGKTVAKSRSINFAMSKGNVEKIPLIFGGTKGSKIKRTLSSTKYEVYSFGGTKMTRTVYTNKVKGATVSISYHSTYKSSGKTYLCTMIPIPASATSRASGWMKTTKGNVAFFYPRDFLGMKYAMK